MNDETTMRRAVGRDDSFLKQARAAGMARIAEASQDAAAVAWAEETADMLVQRLHDRKVS
ncbi:hypothetical protein [Nocardia sp. alder85J]|uniref:hypothetical protein n=1 Tax=Nocardia sp. alder85J TaxID=2862949 RepID=UPI001CD2C632|nr:hypothetical protein [Nocardia sp. alder85J]MCX4099224.1 hypothetical protein [Nocardia sp. alder85J]